MGNKDLIIFSGFSTGFGKLTRKVYAYDTTSPNSLTNKTKWREMQDIPIDQGLTHGAFALNTNLKNNVVYICGGYIGRHPGPATNICLQYNVTAPNSSQWSYLPSLPFNRSGAGMIYDAVSNSLLFTTGSSRPDSKNLIHTIDHNETWKLNLSNIKAGWILKTPIPYSANHVGSVTVNYKGIKERHYILGGQKSEDEKNSNLDNVYEWDNISEKWIQRKSMLFPRGHFSSSTVPYKQCGFIIAAGAINKFKKTNDVSYYNIETDTWYSIGTLPAGLNTPVCDIGADNYFYCETGNVVGAPKFSWRQQII